MENIKHRAVFMGQKVRKTYYVSKNYRDNSFYRAPKINESFEKAKDVKLYEMMMDNPPLVVGQWVYIEALDEKVKVIDLARIAEGGYVYYTEMIVEAIEDYKTKESLDKAKDEHEIILMQYNAWLTGVVATQQESEKKKNKWWE